MTMKHKTFIYFTLIFVLVGVILIQFGCDKTEENKKPTCAITNPNSDDEIYFGELITISIDADDTDGNVTEVWLYIDGSGVGSSSTFPYNFQWNTLNEEVGNHVIKATAKDNNGGSSSDEIVISIISEIVTDADGNTYKTIKIGTQIWMLENLKTTKYNDGTAIPLVTDLTEWQNLTTPGFCWYDNDEIRYKNTYGALYNWYTVNTGKLSPSGWHVPSDAEWQILIDYIGGNEAGGKLKEVGTTHWCGLNIGATNESGFTGLPGGVHSSYGWSFFGIGEYGNWWSTTMSVSHEAWNLVLSCNHKNVVLDDFSINMGFSVRCVKD